MPNTEILAHKYEIHQESVSKLYYYLIGLVVAVLYLIFRISTEEDILTLWASYIRIVWLLGSLSFFFSILWVYRLTKFYYHDAKATKDYESFKDVLECLGLKTPIKLSEVKKLGEKEPELKDRFDAFIAERNVSIKFWPVSYQQSTISCLIFDFYRLTTLLFIIGCLIGGWKIIEGRIKLSEEHWPSEYEKLLQEKGKVLQKSSSYLVPLDAEKLSEANSKQPSADQASSPAPLPVQAQPSPAPQSEAVPVAPPSQKSPPRGQQ